MSQNESILSQLDHSSSFVTENVSDSPKKSKENNKNTKKAPKKNNKKSESQAEKTTKNIKKGKVNENIKQMFKEFLLSKTRPYPLNELLVTFKKEGTKQEITNCLNELASDGVLIKKEYGKSALYLGFKQQSNMSEDEINILKGECDILNKENEEMKLIVKQKKEELNKLCEYANNEELRNLIEKKENEIEENKKRIEDLSGGKIKVEKSDMDKIDNESGKYRKILKERKAAYKNIMEVMLENSGMKRAELLEEMGIEENDDQ